jgi:hypothetical protein
MRFSVVCTVFSLAIAATSLTFSAENSLFSRVRVNSVFDSSTSPNSESTRQDSSESIDDVKSKLSDAGQLTRLLQNAGFESKEVGSRAVSAEKKLGDWSFPLVVTITEDEEWLGIVLILGAVEDQKKIATDKLLSLLDANRKYAPTSFAFSPKRQRFELYHLMRNRQLSGRTVRDEINRLAQIATETESLWQQKTSSGKASTNPQTQTPVTSSTLTGKWSATRSATEAFAIQFNGDGTFVLVYVNGSKQSRSTGKFTLSGESLTLDGQQGFRLTGTVKSLKEKEFEFLPQAAAQGSALLFKRA